MPCVAPAPPSNANTTTNSARGGMVQADPVNNALIITAPDAIYRNLRSVIDQLDRAAPRSTLRR
jgi:general secretion pathway protein D